MAKWTAILDEVGAERQRQQERWGEQNLPPQVFLLILGEEVGEANREALEAYIKVQPWQPTLLKERRAHLLNLRAELIQVAAVAVQMVESLDRNELGERQP